ncbi:MAG: class I SAM-dependent methyltransferase [Methyloceanibacter sp.]
MKQFLQRQFDRFALRAARVTTEGRDPVLKTAGSWMRGGRFDVIKAAAIKAGLESATYYEERMLMAQAFSGRYRLLRHAIELAQPQGLFLEFGVAGGESIRWIADLHPGTVYGFDSFDGLPEDWNALYPKGRFATEPPKVPSNVVLVEGLFADTLPRFLGERPEPISFLHIDCDLYSSTKCVFDHLGPRLEPGTVILFDEYFNYPAWQQDEFKAFQEVVAARGLNYRYDSFVPRGTQVCVVILPPEATNGNPQHVTSSG